MRVFAFQAVDAEGKKTNGTLEAETIDEASNSVTSRGLYLLEISETRGLSARFSRIFKGRVKRSEVIDFANNLSVMVGAGIPLLTAMEDIGSATNNNTLKGAIAEAKSNIEQGSSFSDAISAHKGIFPDIFIRLVRVGEETGNFEGSLSDLAEHLQRMEDLASSIKRALIYPVFAIVTTVGALAFWMIYVLPKLIQTLKGMGVKLPPITRALIMASDLTNRFWYMGIIIPLLVFFGLKLMKHNERGKYLVDLLKLKFPIYKLIEYNRLLALFAEQMRILTVSGLTVDRTLGIVSDVMGNEIFRNAIRQVREDITYGSTIADAVKRHSVFPNLMVRLIGVGESSGTLDDQFGFLAKHYLKHLDEVSDKLGKIIEPLVITTVGVMFALIISGLLLPIYDLVSKVGKG